MTHPSTARGRAEAAERRAELAYSAGDVAAWRRAVHAADAAYAEAAERTAAEVARQRRR